MLIQTDCKDCVFKILKDGKQVGCEHNRLDKFVEAGQAKLIDNTYLISRFCNTCRNEFSIGKNSKDSIRKEVETRIGIIIDCNHNSDKLDITMKSIKNQKYKPIMIYCVYTNKTKVIEVFKKYNDFFRCQDISFNIKNYLEETSVDSFTKEIALKNQKHCQFFTYVKSGSQCLDLNIVDQVINDDMQRIHIFQSKESICFSSALLNQYLFSSMVEEISKENERFICKI